MECSCGFCTSLFNSEGWTPMLSFLVGTCLLITKVCDGKKENDVLAYGNSLAKMPMLDRMFTKC